MWGAQEAWQQFQTFCAKNMGSIKLVSHSTKTPFRFDTAWQIDDW